MFNFWYKLDDLSIILIFYSLAYFTVFWSLIDYLWVLIEFFPIVAKHRGSKDLSRGVSKLEDVREKIEAETVQKSS